MSTQLDLLSIAAEALHEANGMPLDGLSDEEAGQALIAVETVGRLTDSLRAATAAEVNYRSRYELGSAGMSRKFGYTRGSHLIEFLTRISAADASRRILLGKAIRPSISVTGTPIPPKQPLIATAIKDGDVGVDAALHLVRMIDRVEKVADPGQLSDVVTDLLDQTKIFSADLIKTQVKQWEVLLDTDGVEPRAEKLRDRRTLTIGKEVNGMTPFHGLLEPVAAGLLKSLLTDADNATAPKFWSHEDRLSGTETIEDEDGAPFLIVRDKRTQAQRHADVLMGTLKAGLRANEAETGGMRPTTTVSITVSLDDLKSGDGAGWIDQVEEPLNLAAIREAFCDGQWQHVLLGNFGEILYLGVLQRLFSAAQKRAIAARDGGCLWWGCYIAARSCDVHHVHEHSKGGATDVNNGILLCSAHHAYLHHSEFEIKMINGVPHMLAPVWADPTQTWRRLTKARTSHPTLTLPASAFSEVTPATAEVTEPHGTAPRADHPESNADTTLSVPTPGDPPAPATFPASTESDSGTTRRPHAPSAAPVEASAGKAAPYNFSGPPELDPWTRRAPRLESDVDTDADVDPSGLAEPDRGPADTPPTQKTRPRMIEQRASSDLVRAPRPRLVANPQPNRPRPESKPTSYGQFASWRTTSAASSTLSGNSTAPATADLQKPPVDTVNRTNMPDIERSRTALASGIRPG